MIFFLKFNKIILELMWGRTSSKNNIHPCVFVRVQLFAAPWTGAQQAPLSMEFSRQEYWSGLPFPTPGDLVNPGIEPGSLKRKVMQN